MPNAISLRHRLFRSISPVMGAVIPDRHIYPLSRRLGQVLGPYLRRGDDAGSQYRKGGGVVLGACLREFASLGRAFDVPMRVHGLDHVTTAYNQHRRLLLLSMHFPLNLCVHRSLFPLRIPITIVSSQDRRVAWPVCGMPQVPEPTWVLPGPSLYFHLRAALAQEHIVISMFDFGYRYRMVRLTPGPIQFAARSQTPVVFFASALDSDGALRLAFSPALASDFLQDQEACLREVAAFLGPFVSEHDQFRWRKRHKSGKSA